MTLVERSLRDFIAETALSSPTPGGGSASALAGALGTALAEMVINLTVGKRKYADVSAELAALLPKLAQIRADLEAAVDRDAAAFNEVMKAYSLPKETEAQNRARAAAIQEATIGATQVPLGVMEAALKALEMTLIVAQKGNKNSASDAGVAGLLLSSALDGAALNVRINLASLPDDLVFKTQARRKMESLKANKTKMAMRMKAAVAKNLS